MSPEDFACPLLDAHDWRRLRNWYRHHGRHELPWRKNRSPWGILVAETLLHRTRAGSVAELYTPVTEQFPSPAAVVERPELWREKVRPAGLAWRAETFIRACSELVHRHGGHVPGDRNVLMTMPGVGHYVSGAVMCFGFGEPSVLVDTNTMRLAGRISGRELAPSRHRTREVREMVARLGPDGEPPGAEDNFALLDLAALVCTAASPRCNVCPLEQSCVTGRYLATKADTDQGENGR